MGYGIAFAPLVPPEVLWAAIALAVQIIVYLLVRALMPDLVRHIPEGRVGTGVFLGAASLAAGMLNAACMTY